MSPNSFHYASTSQQGMEFCTLDYFIPLCVRLFVLCTCPGWWYPGISILKKFLAFSWGPLYPKFQKPPTHPSSLFIVQLQVKFKHCFLQVASQFIQLTSLNNINQQKRLFLGYTDVYIHTFFSLVLSYFFHLYEFVCVVISVSQKMSAVLILVPRSRLFNNILCFVIPTISVFCEVFRIILPCNKNFLFYFD